MIPFDSARVLRVFLGMLVLAVFMIPQTAKAAPAPACGGTLWNANAGAETKDQAVQADGFFPNEVWIAQNDCIQWTFVPVNEIHTLTLLKPGAVRPSFGPPPCPPGVPPGSGTQPSGSSYDGSACVTSAPMANGATYTVVFPKSGNYKFVCLIHTDMNGTVHVLPKGSPLPYLKSDYDRQAREDAETLLSDGDQPRHDRDDWNRVDGNAVTAGTGEIVATGGGLRYRAVVRFLPGTIHIHAGESVVWTNLDPTEPHTVTFGAEPANFIPNYYSLPPSDPAPVFPRGRLPLLTLHLCAIHRRFRR